ncbi:LCP family protein [Nocardia terpenica]|uniref:Cell envelope-related transcriptional attenuator domain-containing protein n=1 Tax=Nocardia terpenica TaxID=455432 RepID=A0A164H6H3_9NOCA|nr:hypothetical protein AWN90_10030 [Nocardia terpenica]
MLIITPVAGLIYLDRSLNRIPVLADYPGRVGHTAGTNWLLTGSDSRIGLTPEQEKELSTGDTADAGGERSDTIMLVHISQSGSTTVVSLPRDSYVPIPGQGRDKLNAAFAAGAAGWGGAGGRPVLAAHRSVVAAGAGARHHRHRRLRRLHDPARARLLAAVIGGGVRGAAES